ncbi:MAG: glycosyltransferase family 4 protein [Archangiaceae bacterium]|nr:glycosyltransferase family 4 protein [Archangiaceae bacterium]
MSSSLVVHPHFHARFTGATRHVETVVPLLRPALDARVMGTVLRPELPRISWAELWRRAGTEPVIWHAHRVNELAVGLLLRALGRKVRVVWTRHSTGRPARLTSLLARRADRVIAVSPESAQALALPAQVIGHGVDVDRFTAGPPDRSSAWAALGLGGEYGIGVIGRVRPDKGVGDFAAAVKPLLEGHPKWRAALVGLARPSERAWAERLGVHLAGEVSDVERWYRGLSIVVMPSHAESFGLVRAEALAAGCCLVTTRLNALDAKIEHGQNGFVYPPGDVNALREILSQLMRDPARARDVGAAGAELARRELSAQREVDQLRALYASLTAP